MSVKKWLVQAGNWGMNENETIWGLKQWMACTSELWGQWM